MAVVALFGLLLAPVTAPTGSSPAPASASGGWRAAADTLQLPGTFQRSSSGPLIAPQPDASHPIVSVKDPPVLQDENGTWHVFMTTADTSGDWSLAHASFA